jgi:hypothetical protein
MSISQENYVGRPDLKGVEGFRWCSMNNIYYAFGEGYLLMKEGKKAMFFIITLPYLK